MAGPQITLRCLSMLMRPVVRFCLRHALSFQDITDLTRDLFVQLAAEEIEKTGKRPTASKISAMTGLHRRYTTLKDKPSDVVQEERASGSIISRVLSCWEQQEPYCTKAGQPRVLTFQGEDNQFSKLVEEVSTHIHPGSVLFELKRLGIVEESPRGLRRKRQLVGARSPEEMFTLVSRDVEMLLKTAEGNISGELDISNLYIQTEFDNVFVSDVERAKNWLVKEGKAFHRKARNYFARIDKDMVPNPKKADRPAGGRVWLTAFGLAEEPTE